VGVRRVRRETIAGAWVRGYGWGMSALNFPNIPRRRFLSALAGAAAGHRLVAENDRTATVSIFNTTDLHGHILPTKTYEGEEDVGGMARCVTQIRRWQAENPNHILLDIGDVYQGTHVSRATSGNLMIDLFNRVKYDAWVLGNHEFDWGLEAVAKNVMMSEPAVLAANAQAGGKWTNSLRDKTNPLSKVAPYLIKEVGGFRIGIIGVVTPGLPAWLHPGLLKEFSAADPLGSVKFAIRKLQSEKVDAIVLATHFGLKNVTNGVGRPDDFANRIHEITKECRDLAVVIAAHTHKDIGNFKVNGIPYTQANYYGIHCGRTDLVFDRETRKLVGVNVQTVKMDKSVALDPMIIGATQKEVAASEAELKKPIGELAVRLAFRPERPGTAAPSLKLITAAIRHSLGKRKVTVDGVLHGLFLDDKDVAAGSKTIADAWEIIPYENRLATAAIRGADLVPVMQEVLGAPFSTHALEGFRVESEGEGRGLKVKAVTLADGKPVEPEKRYVIGLNAFDAQSGGRRYELLAELVQQSDAALTLHAVESRDALIEFFTEKGTVRLADLG